MNDRLGFTRSIIDAPDDDLPRLAFADWLQEHGEDERAEFIRVQCELARIPPRGILHLYRVNVRDESGRTFVRGVVVATHDQLMSPVFDLPVGQMVFHGAVLRDVRRVGTSNSEVYECEFSITGTQDEHADRRKELFVREAELLTHNYGLRWTQNELAPTGWFTFNGRVVGWRRGFVEELRCPSAEFFDFVDKLYWRKEAKARCVRCDGDGKAHGSDRPFEWSGPGTYPGDCPLCNGTKVVTVPLDCPETAQPIRKVTLTDCPQLIFTGDGCFTWEGYPCRVPLPDNGPNFPHADEVFLERCLAATFPGITFKVTT